MLRQSLIRVRESDYMRTARSKGLSERAALIRHGLRNALTSVVTIMGLQMGALLSGTLITEMIFSWPGLGRLLISAIGARDYPLVEGCVLTFAMTYVVVNMAIDLVYAVIDPRVRIS
jgi:peptide/nickel transport system permease protein